MGATDPTKADEGTRKNMDCPLIKIQFMAQIVLKTLIKKLIFFLRPTSFSKTRG